MLSTSTYYRSFVGRNISELPINETFYDDFVTFNAHLLSKKLLQFYLMWFCRIHIHIWNSQNISLKKRNKNHTLFEQKRRIFPMIKTIILKLLIRLTANFLLRFLVKKYISRIFRPHMNILLTYKHNHVHIIIYIFS